MKKTAKFISTAAIVAALYVVLSLLTYTFSYLEIQCRVAEALCMTIFYTPAGIFGVIIGCFITNLLGGSPIDMIFGTAATLIAALMTYPIARTIRKKNGPVLKMKHALLIPIPTVLVNAIVIPFVLYFGYQVTSFANAEKMIPVLLLLSLSVFIGEAISCYVFGPVLVLALNRVDKVLHLNE
ncbi:MAG: QueT transporter family protein [Lachnospiraceae bacterium]|nr:QueT transporter family protein [Lachnospiraceae bacterium]